MILLEEKWRLVMDDTNVVLQFFENRERKKTEALGGGIEIYEFTDSFYYPTVDTALIGYLKRSVKASESIKDVIKRIKEVEQQIKKLFKNKKIH